MMSLAAALFVATGAVYAQEDVKPEPLPVLAGFRGVGEIWQDPSIVENYRSSRFSGSGFVAFGFNHWLMSELELGYMRTMADAGRSITLDGVEGQVASGALELIPVSASLVAVRNLGGAEAFLGAGFAMAVFSERTDASTVAGAKPGIDFKTGVRVHTSFIEPTFRPHSDTGMDGVDIELMVGRRKHQPLQSGQGFDFSAWRVGAGVVARF